MDTRKITERARQCCRRAVIATIGGCGHMPALNTPACLALVELLLGVVKRTQARREATAQRNAPKPASIRAQVSGSGMAGTAGSGMGGVPGPNPVSPPLKP